jgi:hypothetical protein
VPLKQKQCEIFLKILFCSISCLGNDLKINTLELIESTLLIIISPRSLSFIKEGEFIVRFVIILTGRISEHFDFSLYLRFMNSFMIVAGQRNN